MMEAVEVKTFTASALIFTIVSLGTYFVMKVLAGSIRNGLPLPPSLPAVPVLGSFPFMSSLKDLPEFFRKTSLRLGPVFGVSIGSRYAVVLNTREVIYEALVKKAGAFSGRLAGFTNVHFLNPNEYGIISKQYGQLFRKIHKLSLSILKDFGFGSKILEDRILVEVDELTDIIKEENGVAFNPTRIFSMCTLNVIASMVFGQRLGQKDSTLNGLYKTLLFFMQDKRRHVDVCPALRYLPNYKTVIEKSVANQNAQIDDIEKFSSDSLTSDRDSFVKKFVELEGKDSYDKDELKFIIRDLLIAGAETSSTSTQYAMIRMANYPQVMKRMQAEIDSLVSREDHVTIDHMTSLPYCESVIMEISRSQTVLPLALPHFTLEDAELAGFFIPKGSTVYVNLHSAHMDPKTFEHPEEFNPERFLDQEGRVKGKDLLIPFSIGKRSCLGELLARQEVFLIITNLVHKFDILPPEGEESVTVSEVYMITSFPTPFQLRFIPRA